MTQVSEPRLRLIQSRFYAILLLTVLSLPFTSSGQVYSSDSAFLLRNSGEREWDEFSNKPARKELVIPFPITGKVAYTLSLVQYDVKQAWDVSVNGHKVGRLIPDESRFRLYFSLPPEFLNAGENLLTISAASTTGDDIEVSEIAVFDRPVDTVLSQAIITVTVINGKNNKPIPARITIVDENATLQTLANKSSSSLAIRPGFVYTRDGKADLRIPAGKYTIYAGRGFEYNIDSVAIDVQQGDKIKKTLSLFQEVDTDGWISSDTHIHTLTNSGHGDAKDTERALSIAGEGIELPIITEHNRLIDFNSIAKTIGVDQYFTSVIGNEVTTTVGHFNVFPFVGSDQPTDHSITSWEELPARLPKNREQVIILNHGRDLHNGFRPFDTKNHISIAGLRLDNSPIPVTAMEIINSGALLSEPMSIISDWFGLMNRGDILSPIGSSDSHDVSRYLVGQARTYIQSKNRDVANIDIKEITKNILAGKVMVSFGLLAKISVNQAGPGGLVTCFEGSFVDLEVHGPSWLQADKISLYANGARVFEQAIVDNGKPGLKWKGRWKLPKCFNDMFLVAITEGPSANRPYWPIVKPFQPVNTSWTPYIMGVSGAVKLDANGDGLFTSAYKYAQKLVDDNGKNFQSLFRLLGAYDEAVAIQVASILSANGNDLESSQITSALKTAAAPVKTGFQKFQAARKASVSR